MQQVVEFCEKNHLVLIAIETLQNAIFPRLIHGEVETPHSNLNSPHAEVSYRDIEGNQITPSQDERFKSFRHIINKMKSKQELFSVYSASKGPFYQQSLRAGLLDFMNLDEQVAMQLYKYKSIDLCSAVPGQIIVKFNF
jgi:aspartate/methionine/tyrosine aminotransferase